jgi:hypothetical protein
MHLLTFIRAVIQGVHKGYSTATTQLFSYLWTFVVFGYTEYKGQQKEIFDAAINGTQSGFLKRDEPMRD